ncbi:bifunctional DNA-formamidopyrimidine glycosylase/DNA-(apurinic or apyrimidinic site) lyase [candidate division WOR-3 bacterium]|nr:bifunctional DNA-formamidopyrimidine glycosylase/DNA-(apurinic or apyrimidinic site) lyase [candidate division WOR-3 bacterium]
MPELPEVETIRRAIEPAIAGACITAISLPDPSIAGPEGPEALLPAIGSTVREVFRRGKYLIQLLEQDRGLVIHMRMTGTLLLKKPVANVRLRAVLNYSNGRRIWFIDVRRLGTVRFYEDLKPLLQKLGPEPLGNDVSPESLKESLSKHRIPIKAALLDQHIIAGIGNMYADEALYRAGIHPLTPACQLDYRHVANLLEAIRHVLEQAIACQGASINTYRLPDGERGTAQDMFNVAHKKGYPCPRCGTPIECVMIQKRGAYFCPACQS